MADYCEFVDKRGMIYPRSLGWAWMVGVMSQLIMVVERALGFSFGVRAQTEMKLGAL